MTDRSETKRLNSLEFKRLLRGYDNHHTSFYIMAPGSTLVPLPKTHVRSIMMAAERAAKNIGCALVYKVTLTMVNKYVCNVVLAEIANVDTNQPL